MDYGPSRKQVLDIGYGTPVSYLTMVKGSGVQVEQSFGFRSTLSSSSYVRAQVGVDEHSGGMMERLIRDFWAG
jgi:hypothetical protein